MFDGFISSLKDEFGDFDTSTSEFHLREIYKRREFGREVLKVVKRGAFKSLYELFFNAYRLLKFVDEGEEERFMDMLAMLSSAGYTYSNGDYEALGCIFRDFIKGKGTIVEKIYGRKNDIKAIKGYRFDLSDAGLFYSLNDFSIFDDVESKREFVKNEIGKGEKFDRAFGKVYESNNCIEKMSAAKVIKIYLLINTLYDRGTLSLIKEKSLENLSSRL